jgi:hypothetical protein
MILDFDKWGKVFARGKDHLLDDFEIEDASTSQLLNKGRIFRLPTNLDLDYHEDTPLFNTGQFPNWGLCEDHGYLFEIAKGDQTRCPICIRGRNMVSARKQAIRFVCACSDGHLDDLDWKSLVHTDKSCPTKVYEWKTSSSLSDVLIQCPDCSSRTGLGEIYGKIQKRSCTGRFPEKTDRLEDWAVCKRSPQITLRGSSSLRIPELVTTITVPRRASPVYRILGRKEMKGLLIAEDQWSKSKLIDKLSRISESEPSLIGQPEISVLKNYSETSIIDTINDIKNHSKRKTTTLEEVKDEEFRELQTAMVEGFPPDPTESNNSFQVNKNEIRDDLSWSGQSLRVAPIENLRVIIAQRGYRRLGTDNKNKLIETFYDDGRDKWYVGAEQFGEGIFIDSPNILKIRDSSWSELFSSTGNYMFNPLFVWWHSLSHRIISALGIDSGYSATSIRERIYLNTDSITGERKGGLLLYTTQPGGDGSLGGLISLVSEFERVLNAAERNLELCSNDPLCSEERVRRDSCNGSACYACMLLSETSCEHRNMFLDRNLLRKGLKIEST